jgi:hypothetical protein
MVYFLVKRIRPTNTEWPRFYFPGLETVQLSETEQVSRIESESVSNLILRSIIPDYELKIIDDPFRIKICQNLFDQIERK